MKIRQIELELASLDDLKGMFKQHRLMQAVKSAPIHRRKEVKDALDDYEVEVEMEGDEDKKDEPYGDDATLHASKADLSGLPPEVSKGMKPAYKKTAKGGKKNGEKEV